MMVLFLQLPEMNANQAICMGILVVNDGIECGGKVAEVLRHCTSERTNGMSFDFLFSFVGLSFVAELFIESTSLVFLLSFAYWNCLRCFTFDMGEQGQA